jgi:hypothetical protein
MTMKPTVYIETTIISYLAARPSRDLIVAGHQQITHEWWQTVRPNFVALSSQLVAREAGAGDAEAAAARLAFMTGLTLLEISEEALELAQQLLLNKAIPQEFPEDALHVAVAVACRSRDPRPDRGISRRRAARGRCGSEWHRVSIDLELQTLGQCWFAYQD